MSTKHILFFILAISYSLVFSQEKNKNNAPLKEVLLLLEKKHNIKFSYADEIITNEQIEFVPNRSLSKNIKLLEKATVFSIEKVTDRYYTVSKRDSFLCGIIKDLNSGSVLVGATITINNKSKGVVTDDVGHFKLSKIKKSDIIEVSFVGYASKIINIEDFNSNLCKEIKLQRVSSILNEVQISNYLTTGINKKKDGALSIKPQSLGILPGLVEPDVLQSLQLLPGIQSPNETVAGLHIRGGTPDQNLILYDGIKIYNSAHFFGMISAFNPYITEKISVYRGAARAEYGNHVSGVIDIESDDKIPTKFSGGFGTNLTHADVFTKIPIGDRVGVNISARRSFTDIVNTSTIDKISKKVFQNTIIESNRNSSLEEIENDDNFYFLDYNIKINYKPSDKDLITISHLYTENTLDYLFNFNNNLYSTNDNLDIKNYGINTKWVRNFSSIFSLNTSINYSKYDFKYDFNGEINFQNNQFIDTSIKNNLIKNGGLKSILDINLNTKSSLKFGYEFAHSTVNYELGRTYAFFPEFNYSFDISEHTNNHALFTEYNFLNDYFFLSLGARVNHFSLSDSTFFSPRMSWEAALDDNFWLKSSYEYKQQNISQLLEFTTTDFGLENQVWVLSDDDVVPILKSSQLSFGFTFQENRWTLDFDLYTRNIKGLTSLINGFNNIQDVFSNGNSSITGLDVYLKKSWKNYNTWLSYTYQDIEYNFEGINNAQDFPGNFDIAHNLNWTHNLRLGNFDFSLGYNYRSGLPYSEALSLNRFNLINFGPRNQERLKEYQRWDFSTTYSFNFSKNKKWRGKIGLSLFNILDKKNILMRDHEVNYTDEGEPFINRIDNISQGFTPNLVFRVNFN